MENNVLIKDQNAAGTDEILKVTALLYLKEALVTQRFEACQELVDTARKIGVDGNDISAVIAEYLNADNPVKPKGNRLRTYKKEQ